MTVALLSYTHPCNWSLQFQFPVKKNCCQKTALTSFCFVSFVICKFIFYSKLVLFLMFTQAERQRFGKCSILYIRKLFFPLKIGDLQQNHISITMKSTSYELANFGFHVSFVFVFFFLFILLLLCECMPCVLPVFLRSVSVPLDVNVLYEENCVFVQFVVSCDCSSLAGCKCI